MKYLLVFVSFRTMLSKKKTKKLKKIDKTISLAQHFLTLILKLTQLLLLFYDFGKSGNGSFSLRPIGYLFIPRTIGYSDNIDDLMEVVWDIFPICFSFHLQRQSLNQSSKSMSRNFLLTYFLL